MTGDAEQPHRLGQGVAMRRKVGLFFLCGVVLPLVFAATASAQGATLVVSDSTPAPDQRITVTGRSFSGSNANGPVNIRLDSRSGEPLASATPDSSGFFSQDVRLPADMSQGWHLLIATQTTNANGRQTAFTPGRTRLNVGGTSGSSGVGAPGGGGLPGPPLALLAGGSALILLAGAATLTARRRLRTPHRPQLGS